MKILITKFRSLGDVILLTPLIRNLKTNYPGAQIDLMLNKGTELMVKHNPQIGQIILHDRFWHRTLTIWQRIKIEFQTLSEVRRSNYDIVISTDRGDRGARIAYFSGAKIRIGRRSDKSFINKHAFTHHFLFQGQRHIVELNLDPLRLLKLPIHSKGLEVHWSPEDNKRINKLTQNLGAFIHIHPVSQCLYKSIDDLMMANLIDYCELELDIRVVLTAAPVEQELNRIESILSHTKANPVNLAGKISLLETAALNKLSKMLIVVDTAIMHIATANQVPVLAFFGPTAVDNWGPWDKTMMHSTYQRSGGLQQHGMHRVLMGDQSCVPCSQLGCNNSGMSNCLNTLNFEMAKQQVLAILNEQKH